MTEQLTEAGSLSLGDPRRLTVSLGEGDVVIVGDDGSPTLTATRCQGMPIAVKTDHRGTYVGHDSGAGILTWANRVSRHPKADVRITVPRDCVVNVETAGGTLTVSGLLGKVVAKVGKGHLTLGDLSGPVEASLRSGDVEASRLGAGLVVHTGSGSVTVDRIRGPRVHVNSSKGDINVDLFLEGVPDISLNTAKGDVIARVGPLRDAGVHVSSATGDVTVDVPGLVSDGVDGHGTLQGKVGSGKGRIRLRSSSGRAALLTRSAGGES